MRRQKSRGGEFRIRSAMRQQADKEDGGDNGENQECDLPGTVRPFALYLAGARIDHDLEQVAAEAVGAHPAGQEQVAKEGIQIGGIDLVDLLLVAPDIGADIAVNLLRHHALGMFEAFGKLQLVALCLERSEEHTSELQSRENLVCR